MSAHVLTTAEKQQIVERYQRGERTRLLAAEFHVDAAVVRETVRQAGVRIRQARRGSPLTVEQSDEIVRRYRDGETSSALAAEFGVSGRTVLVLLHARQEPVRAREANLRVPSSPLPVEVQQEIAARYARGESSTHLAGQFGITAPTVRQVVRRQGGVLRARGGRIAS